MCIHAILSTETALSETVDYVEKAIFQGQQVLMVSLDCTGAFDHIDFASAQIAMSNLGIDNGIIEWYQHLLKHRRIIQFQEGVVLKVES